MMLEDIFVLKHPLAFKRAMLPVLDHEGWNKYTNDPVDPGGATRWGISLRYLRTLGEKVGDLDGDGDVDWQDIQNMTLTQAMDLYFSGWWDRYPFARIIDPEIATKLFDASINMGTKQAVIIAQRAMKENGIAVGNPDGNFGPMTLAGLNRITRWIFLKRYRDLLAGFYIGLIATNPEREKYRNGWLNRAYF